MQNKEMAAIFARIELPGPEQAKITQSEMPWYLQALATGGAFLGMSLILGFLFAAELLKTEESAIVIGFLLLVSGMAISHINEGKAILAALTISLALTGAALFLAGLGFKVQDIRFFSAAGITTALFMVVLLNNQSLRFLSTLLFYGFCAGLLYDLCPQHALAIASVFATAIALLFFEKEAVLAGQPLWREIQIPVSSGSAWALLLLQLAGLSYLVEPEYHSIPWLATGSLAFAIFYIAARAWLRIQGLGAASLVSVCLILAAMLAPVARSPGISAAILIVAAGFEFRRMSLQIGGILFLAIFIFAYYYSLEITLLKKSIALMGSGVLFLAGGTAVHRYRRKPA